jgi:phage terminase large subunit
MEINKLLNYNHQEFFQDISKEIVFYGGAGAGKSYSTADKIIINSICLDKPVKTIVIRKSMPSIRKTCWELLKKRAELFSLPVKVNKNEMTMEFANGSSIYFLSIHHSEEIEKIKSITDCDFLWVEEANEVMEAAYDTALLRLRGGNSPYKQSILTFNPIGMTSWIYDRFFISLPDIKKYHTTVDDNPFIDSSYIDELEKLKERDKNLYRVYRLGEWGNIEGNIYNQYSIVDEIPSTMDKDGDIIYKVKDIAIGIDFGFNNETAVVKCYFDEDCIYLEELLYQTNLTNQDLIGKLKSFNMEGVIKKGQIMRELIYCRAGFKAKPSDKSVKDGIDYCKRQKLNVLSSSTNIIKELQSYVWQRDKDGRWIDIPVKFRDHLMDAMRYCIYTHVGKPRFEFKRYEGLH